MSRVLRRRFDDDGGGHNSGTILRAWSAPQRIDAKQLFHDHWPAIRGAAARYARQGVVVLAFDDQVQPIGELWLEASLDRARAAIVGRHSCCDLHIPDAHADVSLRHLAIVVRAVDHQETRLRVLDLRTGAPFVDEAARELDAVVCDAPLFLRLGRLTLAMLRTPEPGGWPDDPALAYASLPERVFVEERAAVALPPPPPMRAVRAAGETIVRSLCGPVTVDEDLCGPDALAVGVLSVSSGTTEVRYKVAERALARGVLLGRYARCQVGLANAFAQLSRVHLLLVRDGDDLLAIDTASTNGVAVDDVPRRIAALTSGAKLELASDVRVRWDALG